MNEEKWIAWEMQTSKTWDDISDVMKHTNIEFIDFDHKNLVEYTLKLNRVIQQSEIAFTFEVLGEIKNLLSHLYKYAIEHFDREENFMRQYKLPNRDAHKREHDRILQMLQAIIEDFTKGKVKIGHELKSQIMNWLMQHINVTDINFFDIQNWSRNLVDASDWNAVKDIIKLTGISEIDTQHKDLTEKAIQLMMSVSESNEPESLNAAFSAFKAQIQNHFDYEKQFIAQYDIQNTEPHLANHAYFVEKLEHFPEEIGNGRTNIEELKIWILTWWINHINVTDKETFDYSNWAYQAIEKAKVLEDVSSILRLTHIASIDQDHLLLMKVTIELNQLVSDYNSEHGTLDAPQIKNTILEMFRKIYTIAEHHFQREEKIMKRHQLLDTRSHSTEHGEILIRIQEMMNNYENNRLYISGNIKTIILDWWIHHTNNVDYKTFVSNLDASLVEKMIEEERVYEKL